MSTVLQKINYIIICTCTGIVSSHLGVPLTIWISIQVGFTLLAVYAPVHFKQLKENKWKWHFLHIASLVAGIASALFPALLTLGVVGYSSLDTKFPPIVYYAAGHRSHLCIPVTNWSAECSSHIRVDTAFPLFIKVSSCIK